MTEDPNYQYDCKCESNKNHEGRHVKCAKVACLLDDINFISEIEHYIITTFYQVLSYKNSTDRRNMRDDKITNHQKFHLLNNLPSSFFNKFCEGRFPGIHFDDLYSVDYFIHEAYSFISPLRSFSTKSVKLSAYPNCEENY